MQVLVKRTRPTRQDTPKPQATAPRPGTMRTRAVLRGKSVEVQRKEREARERIYEHLKSIAKCDAAIDKAVVEKNKALEALQEAMDSVSISRIDDGVLQAEIKEGFTRPQRKVDPQKYRNLVTNEQFWTSIEIPVGVAKTFIGDAELSRITSAPEPESTGMHLRVTEVKRK